jgi:hypothetical protein
VRVCLLMCALSVTVCVRAVLTSAPTPLPTVTAEVVDDDEYSLSDESYVCAEWPCVRLPQHVHCRSVEQAPVTIPTLKHLPTTVPLRAC